MQKGKIIGLLKQHGDVIISSKDLPEPSLCTLEFKTSHIKKQTKGKKPWPKNKTDIVVFNWTINRYSIFNPQNITEAIPLSKVLNNFSNPLLKETK